MLAGLEGFPLSTSYDNDIVCIIYFRFSFTFSVQPNLDTRAKQIDAWCHLVLAYFKHKKIYRLDITEVQSSELFNNKKINSILSSYCCHFYCSSMIRAFPFIIQSRGGGGGGG